MEQEDEETLQRVEDGEEVDKRQVEGSPGEQSEAPGQTQEDDESGDAAEVRQDAPVRRLVMWVLPLDSGQLDQDHDEDDQAEGEDEEEVGHHSDVEGQVVTQPTEVICGAVGVFSIRNQPIVVFVHCYCNNHHNERNAPAHDGELHHVVAQVRREHSHDAEVHVQRLQPRPRERRQQEVVLEEGRANAESIHSVHRQPAVHQEHQVQQQEGDAQLHQDLSRDVTQQFLKRQVGEDGDGQEHGRDSTADVSDESEDLRLLTVSNPFSGEIQQHCERREVTATAGGVFRSHTDHMTAHIVPASSAPVFHEVPKHAGG